MSRLLLSVILLISCAGCKTYAPDVRIDPPVPTPTLGSEIAEMTRSTVSLPLTIHVGDVQSAANQSAPTHFEDRVAAELTHWLTKDWYRYRIDRGDISLGTDNGRLTYSVPFSGQFSVGGDFGAIIKKAVQETADVKGSVHGSTGVTFDTDWSATVDPSLELRADKAEVKFLNLVTVSVRGKIQDALNPKLPGIAKEAANKAISDLNVKSQIAAAWDRAFLTTKVNESPALWLRVEPQEVRTAPVSIGSGDIRLAFGLTATTTLFVSEQAPELRRRPLPGLVIDPNTQGRFDLSIPVHVSLTELQKSVQEQMWGYEFENEGVKLKITNVTVNTSGDRIVLAFDFDSTRTGEKLPTLKAKGRMYALGRLQFDAQKQELRVVDIDYDVQTKNLIVNLADWLFKPKILEVATKAAVIDATKYLDQGKQAANASIAGWKSPDGKFVPSISITDLKMADARVSHSQAFVLFRCQGQCSAVVTP